MGILARLAIRSGETARRFLADATPVLARIRVTAIDSHIDSLGGDG
jgi:hypothetical protein